MSFFFFFVFFPLQICNHNTLFWHLYESTALWEQYFLVPGNLWNFHCLSLKPCIFTTESYGLLTNPDAVHVPGGTYHFAQHLCGPNIKEDWTLGKESVFFSSFRGYIGHIYLKPGVKRDPN